MFVIFFLPQLRVPILTRRPQYAACVGIVTKLIHFTITLHACSFQHGTFEQTIEFTRVGICIHIVHRFLD